MHIPCAAMGPRKANVGGVLSGNIHQKKIYFRLEPILNRILIFQI
ncbi:hypothetical protein LEP1GSC036_4668 [Leptospira weilii str. 2006001853]|uniref:Uncharacterized protein n=2 Tax=Leptospira weilii TaxID=28184 RepID=A0A828Z3W5_9LEPT|nr:hypothetical protein LEP1GSC036_4668 [Leptospira weilii str. 2006001853]EMJ61331.1 hypothetical protein LEP1GSC051_2379 [Leptospira sp. P2653]EMN88782.1 hypothetical protein LEP1GSC108_1355 [Leptospira weilii str. UI 13098]